MRRYEDLEKYNDLTTLHEERLYTYIHGGS